MKDVFRYKPVLDKPKYVTVYAYIICFTNNACSTLHIIICIHVCRYINMYSVFANNNVVSISGWIFNLIYSFLIRAKSQVFKSQVEDLSAKLAMDKEDRYSDTVGGYPHLSIRMTCFVWHRKVDIPVYCILKNKSNV